MCWSEKVKELLQKIHSYIHTRARTHLTIQDRSADNFDFVEYVDLMLVEIINFGDAFDNATT